MSQDFFGYSREVKSKELLSSDFALISIDGGQRMGLVQNVNAQYGHRVEPRFEAGTSDLYWVQGQPSGSLTMSRLVGKRGFFDQVNRTGCGSIQTLNITLSGNACGVTPSGNTKLNFGGAVLQGVGISFNVGSLDMQDTLAYVVAKMSLSNSSALED